MNPSLVLKGLWVLRADLDLLGTDVLDLEGPLALLVPQDLHMEVSVCKGERERWRPQLRFIKDIDDMFKVEADCLYLLYVSLCVIIRCQYPRTSWSPRTTGIFRLCQPGKIPAIMQVPSLLIHCLVVILVLILRQVMVKQYKCAKGPALMQ